MEVAIGQVIGDYEVIGLLGAGGMGKVFKVRNIISERIDAMKILRPGSENAADAANRFLREIKLQASLRHPNIALLHTAMRLEDEVLMFMELVEGVGLDQKLRRGSLPPAEAVSYAAQCLRALEYAHQRGVVHRDIKPSNLIITSNGTAKLVDFGIARGSADLKLTSAGMAVGSAHYMSPEQALGHDVDGRSDLYSVGVLLYEMLIGARPFAGDSAYSVLRAHIEQEPLSPADVNPTLAPELCSAVLRALAKDRNQRFASATAFREALEGRSDPLPPTMEMPGAHAPDHAPAEPLDSPTSSKIVSCLAAELGPIAQHLFKQASAKHLNTREMCLSLAEQVKDETGRHRFLSKVAKELGMPALTESTAKAVTSAPTTKSGTWNPEVLERARKALASHIGPVAKIVVDKASRKCSTIDQLYDLLAAEISSDKDRAKFLTTKPQ